MEPYLVHQTDPQKDTWEVVPSEYDPETQQLTAVVDAFSGYEVVGEYPPPGSFFPFQNWPQTSLYSGAATYAYPIATPPGRNGMGPSVSLSYSSRGLDGIGGIVQSSDVGLGWSLGGEMKIMRVVKTHEKAGGTRWKYERDFTLTINGASYSLIEDPQTTALTKDPQTGAGSTGCVYYTEEYSNLRVMRYNPRCGYNGLAAPPAGQQSRDYWIVTAPNGSQYRFGFTEDSEQMVLMKNYAPGVTCHDTFLYDCSFGAWGKAAYAGEASGLIPMAYRLDRARDVHGNTITYQYTEEHRGPPNYPLYERGVHLKSIQYGGNDVQGTTALYLVEFTLEERRARGAPQNWHDEGPDGYEKVYSLWETKRVRSIRVCASAGASVCPSGDNLIAEYVLVYDTPKQYVKLYYRENEMTLLVEIHPYGRGGESGGQSLPVVQIDYAAKRQLDDDYEHQQAGGNYLNYYRLARVENGYGGWVEFDYAAAGFRCDGAYSYRVQERRQGDGLGHTARIAYAYGPACYADWKNNGQTWLCIRRKSQDSNSLMGHDWMEETIRDYDNSILARVKHYFHNHRNQAVGRAYLTETRAPDNSLLQSGENTWSTQVNYGGIAERYRSDLAEVKACQETLCSRTAYTYDTYGNVTRRTEYDEGDDPYRQTLWGYYPDTTLGIWIVNKPGWENVYSRTGSDWSLEASTWYAYDGDPRYNGQIGDNVNDRGELSAVRSWRGSDVPASECMIDVRYGYDAWGNRTSETTYDGYGDYDTFASAGPRVTTINYDLTYHLFPRRVRNAKYQYSYTEYYGVNQSSACLSDGYSFGAVCRSYGPNGTDTATLYAYDPFGRLKSVVRPGDSGSIPTILYVYDHTSVPFKVATWQREEHSCSGCTRPVFTFYDGLGRVVETLAERTNGGEEVLSYTSYDALGRVEKEYVPYVVNGNFGSFKSLDDVNRPHTTYTYDALGRVTRVTNPDNTASTTMYAAASAGRFATHVDANGHYKFSVTDVFGRLARVDETLTTLEDPFSSLNSGVWTFSGHQSIDGGALKNTGTGSSYSANFYRKSYSLSAVEGIKVEFKVNRGDAGAVFALETSDGGTYRRWGVNVNSNKLYMQYNNGGGWQYPADLINPIEVGKWYVLTLKVGESGWFYTEVWQKDDPADRGTYLGQMASGKNWRFHHWIYRGVAWLDNYHELEYHTTEYGYNVLDSLTDVWDANDNHT